MKNGGASKESPLVRLRWFEVENFRLFKKTRLELHPEVTVLVGLNDTGKSTLLEAMYLYGQVQRLGFRAVLARDEFNEMGAHATRFRCAWEVNGATWEHEIVMSPEAPEENLYGAKGAWLWKPRMGMLEAAGRSFATSERLEYRSLAQLESKHWQLESKIPSAIFEPTAITKRFHVPPAYLFQPGSLTKDAPTRLRRPTRTGYGWANWLQEIINRRDGTIEALEAEIRGLFPHFRRVGVVAGAETTSHRWKAKGILSGDGGFTPMGSTKRKSTPTRDLYVAIKVSNDSVIWAAEASSGLLLALAHLAFVYASPPGSLLLLEEPENGLNETIMLNMMRTFLAAIRRRNQQLVLTTHQPWWLDIVPHDSIRVTTRDEAGGHVEAPPPGEIVRIVEEKNLYPSEVMSLHGPEGLLRLGRARKP